MTFTWPIWFLLIIPVGLLFRLARIPRRVLTIPRIVTLVLLLLALCGLSINVPTHRGCVVLVADRSLSMPTGSQTQQAEAAELLFRAMGREDELAVVSYGQRVSVEQPPQHEAFSGFVNDVGREASNLGDALDRAVSLIPHGRPGRILILSDGFATGIDPTVAAARAAGSGVAMDYRLMHRAGVGDLAIERIDAPQSVAAAEAFMISAWLQSPVAQEVSYELWSGETLVTSGRRAVPEGRSRLMFRDKAVSAGSRTYELRVKTAGSSQQDPVPENNLAKFLVGVRGVKPLLCVGPKASSLPNLLSASGLDVVRKAPEECDWSLADLAGYSAVLIEDIPAGQIGTAGMENLSAWVSETGGGLFTTGGKNSYGTGGYYKSPLEPILPVSMELRREHRKLSLAIVVALDRSGSMAMTVPGGRTKMSLADAATVEVLNQLGEHDQFGCLAVDSVAHEIVPLSDLSGKAAMESKILKIDSMGGGIFVYEALEKAAAMIAPATAGTKHIILFSDAADSEEPGNYADLLEKCLKAGITVSVIGLGTERDSDAALLKDVARRGGGQCMFTDDAHELPRLFAQDTFLVSRSTFVEDPTVVHLTPSLSMLTSQNFGEFPQVKGYNLCYLRPGATLAANTEDEYHAPLVASWQAGTGRVASYMGEADGQYTGAVGQWPRAGEFFSSLARWVSTQDQGLGPDMLLTQEVVNGRCVIKLHLDSERTAPPFQGIPQLTLLRGVAGQKPDVEKVPLAWTGADVLTADAPLFGGQTLLTSLDLQSLGRTSLPPVCLPYSAEFAPRREGEGQATLDRLARATGGVERVDLGGIWRDLPKVPWSISLAPWLLLTAIILTLLDILQRRTGLLSLNGFRRGARAEIPSGSSSISRPTAGKPQPAVATRQQPPQSVPAPTVTTTPSTQPPPPSSPPSGSEDVLDALSQARNRAARRTQR